MVLFFFTVFAFGRWEKVVAVTNKLAFNIYFYRTVLCQVLNGGIVCHLFLLNFY